MKSIQKKVIASAVAVTIALSASTAFAFGGDNKRGGDYDPAQRFEYIFTQLQLTDTQQADVLALMEAHVEENRQIMWDAKQAMRDSEDRPSREEMQAMSAEHHDAQIQALTDQLNTVLSPELTEDLIQYMEAHRNNMGGKGGKGGQHDRNGG